MAYKEDEYLMLSGIQHFKFCRRQWALIHIEQQWSENVHTVIGELMHKKVHDPSVKEKRKETLLVRALPVSSKELGVSGECVGSGQAVAFPGIPYRYRLFSVYSWLAVIFIFPFCECSMQFLIMKM